MTENTPALLPTVRQVIVCHALSLDDALGAWVVSAPLAVSFLPPGVAFPFRVPQVSVYTQLVGGLGAIRFGVEIRQRITPLGGSESSYREVGSFLDPEPYHFPGWMNRLAVHELAFGMTAVPLRDEGSYEFRVIAQTSEGDVPLEGNVAVITVLAAAAGGNHG